MQFVFAAGHLHVSALVALSRSEIRLLTGCLPLKSSHTANTAAPKRMHAQRTPTGSPTSNWPVIHFSQHKNAMRAGDWPSIASGFAGKKSTKRAICRSFCAKKRRAIEAVG